MKQKKQMDKLEEFRIFHGNPDYSEEKGGKPAPGGNRSSKRTINGNTYRFFSMRYIDCADNTGENTVIMDKSEDNGKGAMIENRNIK